MLEFDDQTTCVPARILSLIRADRRSSFVDALKGGDFDEVIEYAEPRARIPVAVKLIQVGLIPENERAELLCKAILSGEAPYRHRRILDGICLSIASSGQRLFDCGDARREFEGLPERITVYRGTSRQEVDSREFGSCWSLDPDVARWFALHHNANASPILLTAQVKREHIAGLILSQDEHEVLLSSKHLSELYAEPL